MTEFYPASRTLSRAWSPEDDTLWLLTPKELPLIPIGTVLSTINDKELTVGVDFIPQDTRAGYLSSGLRESQLPLLLVSGWKTV